MHPAIITESGTASCTGVSRTPRASASRSTRPHDRLPPALPEGVADARDTRTLTPTATTDAATQPDASRPYFCRWVQVMSFAV